jgi:hypothetical protein
MKAGAPKILIDAQIAAVSLAAQIAHAGAGYRGESVLPAHASALDAAARTLAWVRDNAAPLRKMARGASEKARFADLPLAQQSALRCADARFQKFVNAGDADAAAAAVRRVCGVESRAEFDKDSGAAALWRRLDAEFEGWLRGVGDA